MSSIVNPEPLNVRSMERWAAFRARIHAWPLEKLQARAAQLVEKHFPDHPGRRDALQRSLAEAEEEGELADGLILAALRTGEIRAAISYPPSAHCYLLERFSWTMVFKRPDALKAIEDGVAPSFLAKSPLQTIEQELARRPMFVAKGEGNAFDWPAPPSEAQLRRAAMELVVQLGSAPPKKAEFIAALLERCPGCTAHRAGKAWGEHTPTAWRRPGRRRRN